MKGVRKDGKAASLGLPTPRIGEADPVRHPMALPGDQPLRLEAVQDPADLRAREQTGPDEILLEHGAAGGEDPSVEAPPAARRGAGGGPPPPAGAPPGPRTPPVMKTYARATPRMIAVSRRKIAHTRIKPS